MVRGVPIAGRITSGRVACGVSTLSHIGGDIGLNDDCLINEGGHIISDDRDRGGCVLALALQLSSIELVDEIGALALLRRGCRCVADWSGRNVARNVADAAGAGLS